MEFEQAAAFDAESETQATKNVVIALDTSGSMAGLRIQKAKEGVQQLIGSFLPEDSFSLLTFDSSVEEILPRTKKADCDVDAIFQKVQAIRTKGMTKFYDVIVSGMKQLKETSGEGERKTLVMLTDGDDTASKMSFDEARTALFEPSFSNFAFVVMAINLETRAKNKVAELCSVSHCKMFNIKTRSAKAAAVDTAFQNTITRIADVDLQTYDASEGYVVRERCHSPAYSECESMTDDDIDRFADFEGLGNGLQIRRGSFSEDSDGSLSGSDDDDDDDDLDAADLQSFLEPIDGAVLTNQSDSKPDSSSGWVPVPDGDTTNTD